MIEEQELSSGELAAATGVSADTLRHYEIKGVLPAPPRRGTYRRYPPEAVARVLTIRRALSIGFTLDELGRIFAARARGTPPCRTVMELGLAKRAELDRRIAELMSLRQELDAVLSEWSSKLDETPDGQTAGLLDKL